MSEGRHDDPSLGLDDERHLLDDPSRVRNDGVVDARGLRCPAPIILLARAARADGSARVLTVWWTDPAARTDIGAWARMRGHEVLGTEPLAGSGETADDDSHSGGPASDDPAYATRVRLTPTAAPPPIA